MTISPRSPRIVLSNDTFGERKCCEVFTCESETFHRPQLNGISHSKNGVQPPKNLPFLLHDVDPHVIVQCLGPPHAPPQTAAPTVEAMSHTYRKVAIDYNDAPQIHPQKYHFSWADPQTPVPASSLDPSDLRFRSAVFFPQCTGQTDAQTDRSFTGKFDDNRSLRL